VWNDVLPLVALRLGLLAAGHNGLRASNRPIVMVISREIYEKESEPIDWNSFALGFSLSRLCVKCFLLVARLENIPFAATGMNKLGRVLVVDLFAQMVDVNLDRIRKGIERIVPDVFGNLRARDNPACVASQIFEQGVLFRRQIDLSRTTRYAMAR